MNRYIFILVVLISFDSLGYDESDRLNEVKMPHNVSMEENITRANYKIGDIKHIVLFRYKESVSAGKKEEVKRQFLALKKKSIRDGSPYIVSIVTGAQNSREGVDFDFEQAFIVTFKSEGDRNYYVGQPVINDPQFYDVSHQDFKAFVGPLLHEPIASTGVLVFDFKVESTEN